MRTHKLLVGNWKMHTTPQEGLALVEALLTHNQAKPLPLTVLMPPFTHLGAIAEVVGSVSNMRLGAQCCHEYTHGAYTGGISADMLAALGIAYVLVGHSERRQYYQEQADALLGQLRQALRVGISPIFCCGEPLAVRQQNQAIDYVQAQLSALGTLPARDMAQVIIAYEPIWAIGTNEVANTGDIQAMHAAIYQYLAAQYDVATAQSVPILYGGSVKPMNAADIFACQYVDGALVGGASLEAESFAAIAYSLADNNRLGALNTPA